MGSPLNVLLEPPPHVVVVNFVGRLYFAERICTFVPRVTAKRKQWLLEAAAADAERQ